VRRHGLMLPISSHCSRRAVRSLLSPVGGVVFVHTGMVPGSNRMPVSALIYKRGSAVDPLLIGSQLNDIAPIGITHFAFLIMVPPAPMHCD